MSNVNNFLNDLEKDMAVSVRERVEPIAKRGDDVELYFVSRGVDLSCPDEDTSKCLHSWQSMCNPLQQSCMIGSCLIATNPVFRSFVRHYPVFAHMQQSPEDIVKWSEFTVDQMSVKYNALDRHPLRQVDRMLENVFADLRSSEGMSGPEFV